MRPNETVIANDEFVFVRTAQNRVLHDNRVLANRYRLAFADHAAVKHDPAPAAMGTFPQTTTWGAP